MKVALEKITNQKIKLWKNNYTKKQYPIPKWVLFAEVMIRNGFCVKLCRAVTTVSKYLYLSRGEAKFKVRFSNHPPNKEREKMQDSDYYVGIGNFGIKTTRQVIQEILTEFVR